MTGIARTLCGLCSVFAVTAIAGSRAGAQQLNFTPDHPNDIYAVGERVGWRVAVAPGERAAPGLYRYLVKRDGMTVVDSGSFDIPSANAKVETSLDRPGMLLIEVRPPAGVTNFRGRSKSEIGRVLLGAAVAPTAIRPSAPRPPDFDAFWSNEIGKLQAIPADPVLTPGESDNPDVDYYTIKMNNIKGAHVYGQLARPSRAGRFPALLIMQYASPPYPLQKQWVTDRAAEGWLVLNVEPHDVPSDMPQAFYDALPALIKNYTSIGTRHREDNYFLRMYLGDYRAVDYLASRPDWDGTTLVVQGMSMGGQQSFAVAGLNPKVTGLIVDVPAGCDLMGALHGRAEPYPNWDVTQPDIARTAAYFDAANFASHIKVRALVAMGFIDEIATPAGIWAAFNEMRGPKEAAPMIESPHNNFATLDQQMPYTRRSAEWLDALMHGKDPTASGVHR
ncbi:MAG TPA: acetylxylan esterase [Gemmatimonadaceae bacterium]